MKKQNNKKKLTKFKEPCGKCGCVLYKETGWVEGDDANQYGNYGYLCHECFEKQNKKEENMWNKSFENTI